MDWYWTRSSIRSSLPSGKKTEHSSSTRRTTSRRRWSDRILETERWSSEQIWKLSILVWWWGNKKRFQYSTHSSGQKFFNLQALQGHSGRNLIDPTRQDDVLIPNEFFEYIYHIGCAVSLILHHKFRIDSGRTKFLAGTDRRYFSQPWIPCIRIIKIRKNLIWPKHVLHFTSKSGKFTKILCTGSIFNLLNEKDWCSVK